MKAPVLLLALDLLIAPSIHGQDWSPLNAITKNNVFRLESSEGKCSVFLVNQEIVLTAGHCVSENKDKQTSIAVDEKHAEVLKLNTTLDLALLKVAGLHGTPIALRKEDVVPGIPVSVVGYGFAADRLKYGYGWISDPRDKSLKVVGDRLFFAAVGEVPGHSGGALLDAAGKLVALVQGAVVNGPAQIGFGAPTAVIDDFVKPYWPKGQ